jgi:pSer/pThr/pTyr-binding forkhead associated (FHA) protein
MFALEISFLDGVTPTEVLYVRRPSVLIGGLEYAHVVIEDLKNLNYQIRLVRKLGRSFMCIPVGPGADEVYQDFGGLYKGVSTLTLGLVNLQIIALDSDTRMRENEVPDQAGLRVLRQGIFSSSPSFPAIVTKGTNPVTVSFSTRYAVLIGRAKDCLVRFDSSDISSKHARIGTDGDKFWIEDLGSTNGTFINNNQVAGKTYFISGEVITLAREFSIVVVENEQQVANATRVGIPLVESNYSNNNSDIHNNIPINRSSESSNVKQSVNLITYPLLVASSAIVRPQRLSLIPDNTINIGRESNSCDLWIGAPHVSRKHCSLFLSNEGDVILTDFSTNGTGYYGGLLRNGESLSLGNNPTVLDFGENLTIALCFSVEDEEQFVKRNGDLATFAVGNETSSSAYKNDENEHSYVKKYLNNSSQIDQDFEENDYQSKIYQDNTIDSVPNRRRTIVIGVIFILLSIAIVAFLALELIAGY